MANIKISDLSPAGSGFFQDSESFLGDLTEDELGIRGGLNNAVASVSITVTLTVSWTWSWTFEVAQAVQ
jgi:hypothetical protein